MKSSWGALYCIVKKVTFQAISSLLSLGLAGNCSLLLLNLKNTINPMTAAMRTTTTTIWILRVSAFLSYMFPSVAPFSFSCCSNVVLSVSPAEKTSAVRAETETPTQQWTNRCVFCRWNYQKQKSCLTWKYFHYRLHLKLHFLGQKICFAVDHPQS